MASIIRSGTSVDLLLSLTAASLQRSTRLDGLSAPPTITDDSALAMGFAIDCRRRRLMTPTGRYPFG